MTVETPAYVLRMVKLYAGMLVLQLSFCTVRLHTLMTVTAGEDALGEWGAGYGEFLVNCPGKMGGINAENEEGEDEQRYVLHTRTISFVKLYARRLKKTLFFCTSIALLLRT